MHARIFATRQRVNSGLRPSLSTLNAGFPRVMTYAFNGDTNGVFYGYGAKFGAQAWTNPSTAGFITVTAHKADGTQTLGFGSSANQAVDRSATDDCGIGTNAAGNYWKVTLPAGSSLNPNAITIRARPIGSGTSSNVGSYKIQGSNNDSTWTDIATISGLTYVTEADYKFNSFTAPDIYYRYIRLLWQSNVAGSPNSFFFLTDWELYGSLAH